MASLYQRKSDGRWIARVHIDGGFRYVTGTDREAVVRRAALIPEDDGPEAPLPGDDRFWSKVLRGPNCWLWVGSRNELGYGQYRIDNETRGRAHRVAYELLVGPIPEGLTIDHLCRNTWCVNPAHMEPVTIQENLGRRGRVGRRTVPVSLPREAAA